ncbi:hypothetical protein T02_15584 [Trichinella nativa]|uniref:Uncharacterized protein n=1 Tax=Trichinella nativa TaxID=6335 RepID=A0A0V1LPN5_9BILA|nr:hypothetical protein T02_15584 [Trichinella nativa]
MFYLYHEQEKSLAVPLPAVLKLKHKTRLVEVYFGKWARDGKKRASSTSTFGFKLTELLQQPLYKLQIE